MRLPDLLAIRWGRLTAFFALYLTEGIPLGFTATAVATQTRRQGPGPAEIGAFVGWLYLPWAFKWMVGPFLDGFSSDRFGRRRLWIVITQCMMVATLMAALPVNFTAQLQVLHRPHPDPQHVRRHAERGDRRARGQRAARERARAMQQAGWILPVSPQAAHRAVPAAGRWWPRSGPPHCTMRCPRA